MTTDDLGRYEVKTDKPIWGDYKGYQLASMPPPSSGGVFMLQILKILDHFNLSQYDPKSFEKYQLLAETMHLSYADRAAYAGDPEFVDVPLKGLLDDDYISKRASLIQLDQMNKNPKEGDPWAYEDEKIHPQLSRSQKIKPLARPLILLLPISGEMSCHSQQPLNSYLVQEFLFRNMAFS